MVNTSELLFIKSVKDGIPNRDPLNESDARRVFGQEDGRISLSDVSIKRDVRDYFLARYPDGGPEKRNFVFVRKEYKEGTNTLLGRGSLAQVIQKRAEIESDDMKDVLSQAAIDVRLFGAVYSVSQKNFQFTGPVQFGWAHSMHPVETQYTQGTVVIPSRDTQEGGATQGTIWTQYTLPFAVFVMPGIINATIAKETGLSADDVDLLFEGLWKGTLHRQARGRGMQKPLFMLHVEYNDPFFRIGYLEDFVDLSPAPEEWREADVQPSSLQDISLNVRRLHEVLAQYSDKIARIRFWADPQLVLEGADQWDKQSF